MSRFTKLFFFLALAGIARAQSPIFWLQQAYNTATVSAPTFTPVSPYSGGGTTVSITAGATPATGQTIYYCVTTTTCTPSTVYSAPISFTSTENVFAYSTATGYNNSATVEWQGTWVAVKSILQSNSSTVDDTPVTSLTNHTAGGLTCAFIFLKVAGVATPTVTNTAGFSWSPAVGNNTGTSGWSEFTSCAPTQAYTGTDTITVHQAGGVYHSGVIVADISNVTAIDTYQGSSSSTYSIPSTGTFTATGPSDLVFGFISSSGPASSGIGAGFTCLSCAGSGVFGSGSYTYLEYKNFSGSSLVANSSAYGGPWDAFGVALK